MHRIDSYGATEDNRFTDGDPVVPIPPTVVKDDWLNAVQEEIAHVIENSGLALNKADNRQLSAAITARFAARRVNTTLPLKGGGKLSGDLDLRVELASVAEALAGVDAVKLITPATLKNAFSQSLSGHGWCKLPNGLIFQWGLGLASNDAETPLTFPLVFPQTCFGVVMTDYTSAVTPTGVECFGVTAITKTGFVGLCIRVSSATLGPQHGFWFAIGY